jgi:pimeloyl-ACP methyl ester carboxylesterase
MLLRQIARSMRLPSLVLLTTLLVATSSAQPALPEADRIRLAEAFALAETAAADVWEGWGEVSFAVLLVAPEHEFLVRHPRPSADFSLIGYDELLGSEVYVRDRVFPPHLLAAFPAVGGVSTVVIGQPEATRRSSTYWVLTALHEHFHQLQTTRPDYYARVAALDLAGGDETGMWMMNYPFPYDAPLVATSIGAYRDALVAALADPGEIAGYRAARAGLRDALDPADYRYLSFQLWQEGVARYTEIRVAEAAAERHQPLPAFAALDDFVPYGEAAATLRRQLADELAGLDLGARQRVAFYPLGAAEALLLDAAHPGWQARYFDEPFYLERYGEERQSGISRNGLYYEVTGQGTPVVLLHAFSLDGRMWDAQVEALAPHHRVIRYDLRGHGRSALPDGPFAAHDDLAALLDELGVERAALVGLSAGARIAVDFALTHPGRVSRLVLAAPSVSGHVPQERFAWMDPVIAAARAGDAQRAAELWAETPLMVATSDSAAAATVRTLVLDNVHLWGLPSNPERALDPPAAGRLAEIEVPVLVVVGEDDVAATHEAASLVATSIRGARREVVPGVGHLVPLAAPEAFSRTVLDFLASADPADVATADAILGALYDVISGPAGQARDWDRFRGLFAPGGRLIPTGQRRDGQRVMTVQTPEDYINTSGPVLEERGFFEDEIARREERFGNVAHVWSTYEARWTRDDPEPFVRGINSIQLFHDGERWWVVTVMWDSERPDNPIPVQYLPDEVRP